MILDDQWLCFRVIMPSHWLERRNLISNPGSAIIRDKWICNLWKCCSCEIQLSNKLLSTIHCFIIQIQIVVLLLSYIIPKICNGIIGYYVKKTYHRITHNIHLDWLIIYILVRRNRIHTSACNSVNWISIASGNGLVLIKQQYIFCINTLHFCQLGYREQTVVECQ